MNIDAESEIKKLIKSLQDDRKKRIWERYITHIRFPNFKNISPGTRMDFDFPVTALVGANGSGKTSALHALYGAPHGYSTSRHWFSTVADPIVEGSGEPSRFIYGHKLPGVDSPVETRKARVKKANDPDYWEPTKAVSQDNMEFDGSGKEIAGKSKDRWNPVTRDVLFLNFRSELSAFDQYFFFGKLATTKTLNSKQDRLRKSAERLKKAIDTGNNTLFFRGKKVVSENRLLNAEELNAVCSILGKKYLEARFIRHSCYGDAEGISVRFVLDNATKYTEAFAGSGELAIVQLVTSMLAAKDNTLVLLDEPEISLHPGAQVRLLHFLLKQSRKKSQQIVFSTHSPSLIRLLPDNAIKVFTENAAGKFEVLNQCHPYAAFNRLGAPVPDKVRVLVEDRLAKEVVELALRDLPEDERCLFQVDFLPGGANEYLVHRVPTLMHQPGCVCVLLDGDKAPQSGQFEDPNKIPKSEDSTLSERIKNYVGTSSINLGADGGNDPRAQEKMVELQREYLKFLFNNVKFLPASCPEHIVLRALGTGATITTSQQAKNELKLWLEANVPALTAEKYDTIASYELSRNRANCADLATIRAVLRPFLDRIR